MVINNMANTDDHVFRDSSSLLIPDRSRFEGVGMIPFFGSNGSTDVHVTTSGSAVSGMGLYFADDGDDQNIFLTPCGCRCRLIGSLTPTRRPTVHHLVGDVAIINRNWLRCYWLDGHPSPSLCR